MEKTKTEPSENLDCGSQSDCRISKAAEECDAIASKLLALLDKIKVNGKDRVVKRTFKALSAPLKRNKIRSLQEKLEAMQRHIEVYLIEDIREIIKIHFREDGQLKASLKEHQRAVLEAVVQGHSNTSV